MGFEVGTCLDLETGICLGFGNWDLFGIWAFGIWDLRLLPANQPAPVSVYSAVGSACTRACSPRL
jgi:hypothetical protein